MTSIVEAPFFSRKLGKLLPVATAALALATLPAIAQSSANAPNPTLQTVAYSSSTSGNNPFGGEDIDGRSLASAPDGTTKIAPQYGGGYGGGKYHQYNDTSRLSHFAFEVGGGFTAPIGNDINGGFTSLIGDGTNYGTDTWGGNLMAGAGWQFSKRFVLLGEFSYNDNKIPGHTLSAVYNGDAPDYEAAGIAQLVGNVHTYGVTAEPMYYYLQNEKSSLSAYVIGGGGFYHKSINFGTPVEECSIYGFCGNVDEQLSSYSDNAAGFNLGTGVAVKVFGQYSRAKLFAEARYVFVDTPRETTSTNPDTIHTGTEGLVPVTVGIRF
jgi:hypothetical protein